MGCYIIHVKLMFGVLIKGAIYQWEPRVNSALIAASCRLCHDILTTDFFLLCSVSKDTKLKIKVSNHQPIESQVSKRMFFKQKAPKIRTAQALRRKN